MLWEAVLFSFALILGISAGFRIVQLLKPEGLSLSPVSFWQFILYFLIGTGLILIITVFLKLKKGRGIIFKSFFLLVTAWGGIIFLSLWLPGIVSLILIASLIFWWSKKPSVLSHNIAIILGMAGIGSVLGLRFEPLIVVALLIIFSIYDWVAVYKTKHMVKIAQSMIESRAILGLIIPKKPSDFWASLKKVKPGKGFMILGGGDVVFPLILCVSLIPEGVCKSLIVFVFSLLGLLFGFWLFSKQRTRKPIPALPPIALFSIIGYLITRIIP